MSEHGEVLERGTVRFRRVLPGPLQRVFDHLTDPELRGRWFASGPIEPRVGGALTLHFRHDELTPDASPPPPKYADMAGGVTATERITRYEPPHVLAFTFDRESSEVTIELEAQGDEVLLTLTHRRLATPADMRSVCGGWHAHLGVLEAKLRDRVPEPFWPRLEKLEQDYAERIPDAPAPTR